MINSRKVIGIIGGMGPMATADMFRKIIERTDASCDREHLHILIDNNTDIPDRTASILAGSDEPVSYMVASAKRLADAGADMLIISCDTSHFFYNKVAANCEIPILHMPEETAKVMSKMGIRCAGLLATVGTLKSEVYDKIFAKYGIEIVKPDDEGQKKLMHMIYDEVKAGKCADTAALDSTLDKMEEQGCEAFILGCTELPIAYEGYTGRNFLDPAVCVAETAIVAAGGKLKSEVTV
ncbi:MAG: amino acid racemase [Bacillota bacterium]|nr:amino acid racemase [Bacillota bacterium]